MSTISSSSFAASSQKKSNNPYFHKGNSNIHPLLFQKGPQEAKLAKPVSHEEEYQLCYANNSIEQQNKEQLSVTSHTYFRAIRSDEDPTQGLRYQDGCDPNIGLVSHVAHGSKDKKKACVISVTSNLETAASWSGYTANRNSANRGTFVEIKVPKNNPCTYDFKNSVTPHYNLFEKFGFNTYAIKKIIEEKYEYNVCLSEDQYKYYENLLEEELCAINYARKSQETVFRQEIPSKYVTNVYSSELDSTGLCKTLPQYGTPHQGQFCITDDYKDEYIVRLKAPRLVKK